MEKLSCCFIGHRKIQDHERVIEKVREIVQVLVDKGIRTFNFGSRSKFDDICHAVVTEMQVTYPDIERINYNRRSEYVVKKDEKEELEKSWSKLLKRDVSLKDFEGEKMSDRVLSAGKASYVERNQEMIDDSEYCVFFYREEYKPEISEYYRSSGKSGTKMAYDYAMRKKKIIINIAERLNKVND